MKKIHPIFILLLFLFFAPKAEAIYNPTLLPNNIFGIHIVDVNDIQSASNLVNQAHDNKADWGYVTLVIPDNDLNSDKWSGIFRQLRESHLIPIVRLATHVENAVWVAPRDEDINRLADFLNTLPWPIQNRYVVLWNEPNHAKEWGGHVNPAAYARLASDAISTLKAKSNDFFILPAGLDLYAPNGPSTMDATTFWQRMENAVPGILLRFDGLTSHSYPSHEYSGSPVEDGRHSVVGYQWELNYLATNYQVRTDLPVFITETGWAQNSSLTRDVIADYYTRAFADIWSQDKRIVAVTPFLLNYQDGLFARFSWRKLGSDEFYPQYSQVQSLAKVIGQPLIMPASKFGEILFRDKQNFLARLTASLH